MGRTFIFKMSTGRRRGSSSWWDRDSVVGCVGVGQRVAAGGQGRRAEEEEGRSCALMRVIGDDVSKSLEEAQYCNVVVVGISSWGAEMVLALVDRI